MSNDFLMCLSHFLNFEQTSALDSSLSSFSSCLARVRNQCKEKFAHTVSNASSLNANCFENNNNKKKKLGHRYTVTWKNKLASFLRPDGGQ